MIIPTSWLRDGIRRLSESSPSQGTAKSPILKNKPDKSPKTYTRKSFRKFPQGFGPEVANLHLGISSVLQALVLCSKHTNKGGDSSLSVRFCPKAQYRKQGIVTVWFLVGNGGMDPSDSPLRSPTVVPITHSPIPY